MKKRIASLLCALLMLIIAGCGSVEPPLRIDGGENYQPDDQIVPVIPDAAKPIVSDDPLDSQFADQKVQILPDIEIEWAGYHNKWQDSSQTALSTLGNYLIDNSVFYFKNAQNGFDKYSLKADVRLPVCTDPGCAHASKDCIAYSVPKNDAEILAPTVRICFSYDNVLYFSVNSRLYRYISDQSKTELLADFGSAGAAEYVSSSFRCMEYKSKIYIQLVVLKEGGNEAKPEDYGLAVYSMNMDGTGLKEIKNHGDHATAILAVANDRIYYVRNDWTIVKTDLNGKNEQELFTKQWLRNPIVIDDRIIYSVITETWKDNNSFKACNLYSYDLENGTHTLICDERVAEYQVTDQFIYYIPRPDGRNYLPLYRMKHDGSEKTEVQKITLIQLETTGMSYWAVEGDYMIAVVAGNAYCIDLTNGAYTRISSGTSKWYKMNYR